MVHPMRHAALHTAKAALAKPEALSHHQAVLSLQLLTKLLIFSFLISMSNTDN